jgi:hypothetical protein
LTRPELEALFTIDDPQAGLVDQPVVTAAQQDQIFEPGGTAIDPVPDVVAVDVPCMGTARTPAMLVSDA